MDLAALALVPQVILQHSEVPSQLVEKYSPEASLMLETQAVSLLACIFPAIRP